MTIDTEVATTSKAAAQQELKKAAKSSNTEKAISSSGSANTSIDGNITGHRSDSGVDDKYKVPPSNSNNTNSKTIVTLSHTVAKVTNKSDATSGNERSSTSSSSSSVSGNISGDTRKTTTTTVQSTTITTATAVFAATSRMQDSIYSSANPSVSDKNPVMTTNLDGSIDIGGGGGRGGGRGGGGGTVGNSGNGNRTGTIASNTLNDSNSSGRRNNGALDATGNINNGINTTTNGHDLKQNGVHVNDKNTNNDSTTALSNVCEEQNNHDVAKTIAWLGKTNQEIIRLIGQYLQDLGLESSVKTLMKESGCYLEHPSATKFREHVLSGEWKKADGDLKVKILSLFICLVLILQRYFKD